jgi:hypothetical protein
MDIISASRGKSINENPENARSIGEFWVILGHKGIHEKYNGEHSAYCSFTLSGNIRLY